MELRPFRSLRYAPRLLFERGLATLLSPPVSALPGGLPGEDLAPENILQVVAPRDGADRAAAAGATLSSWLSTGVLLRERRPGLWVYRRATPGDPGWLSAPLLVGLVRLGTAPVAASPSPRASDPRPVEELLSLRRSLRADFEPCLFSTRGPLSGALATTRQPDLSAEDSTGARHDAWRLSDYAQHVELQGLVKNAEAALEDGAPLWEAARQMERDPEAAKLPGARFKLCAIVEEAALSERRGAQRVGLPLGLFGVSLEDPVY